MRWGRGPSWRRSLGGLIVLTSLAGACASSGRDASDAAPPDAGPAISAPAVPLFEQDAPRQKRAGPRWEEVVNAGADGSTESAAFTIAAEAIQWRLLWSCEAGSLKVSTLPPPQDGKALVDSACPAEGEGFSIETGERRLAVEASGPWKATVEQQVETPIDEAPLPEMASAPVVAQGSFYEIDEAGEGTVKLYQLADGRRALRLEGFEVKVNTDLVVWLSTFPHPTTSAEAVGAPYTEIAELKSTIGPQNYVVPPEVATDAIRSVVIWCPPTRNAYLGATLMPGGGAPSP